MPKTKITLDVDIPDGWEPTGKAAGVVGHEDVEAVISYLHQWTNIPGVCGLPFRRISPPYEPVKVQLQPMETAPKDGKQFFVYGMKNEAEGVVWLKDMFCLTEDRATRYEFDESDKGWFRVEVEG